MSTSPADASASAADEAPALDPGTVAGGLDALAERVRQDLALLEYPKRPWLTPRRARDGQPIHDVVIVGGGQSGLAAAFGLMRERVDNILVVDENPPDRAGPWLSFARMRTLRTPKHLTGPDLGIPSLTPRAWYEAQHGARSWDAMGLLPKEAWADYLAWYRRTLSIPVRARTRVGALRWDDAERAWEIPTESRTGDGASDGREAEAEVGARPLRARRVVLATGIDGSGQWQIPPLIRDALPPRLYAHTHDPIDFGALRGRRVAVLGAGASAFDNAATALEEGAREVRLYFRRPRLVTVNAYRWAEFAGFLRHHGDLPDADKWRFILEILRMGQLPPADTYDRARRLPGFHLHAGAALSAVTLSARGDEIALDTAAGRFTCDFLIVATGFVTDLALRPELRHVESHIARWSDRYEPPESERHEDLARHPYLGPGFELTERQPGAAPYLGYLFNYTFGCLLSLGFGGASISGMKYSIPRLTGGITRSLFLEDREAHLASLRAFSEAELT